GFVVGRGADPGVALDVAAQVQLVGDVVQVAEDFGLGRVALAPGPFLEDVLGEPLGEAVIDTLAVAARAGVAVPVPGAADIAPRLIDARRKAPLAQAVEHVKASKAGPNDHCVKGGLLCRHSVLPPKGRFAAPSSEYVPSRVTTFAQF